MNLVYLDNFFSNINRQQNFSIIDYSNVPNNCDIIGISFYNNFWHDHSKIIEQLLPKTKKLLINLSEPTTGSCQGSFLDFLKFWDRSGVYTFSDAVLNVSTPANFATAISWFVDPTNIYASKLWAIKRVGRLDRSFDKKYHFDCLLGRKDFHRDIIEKFYLQSKFCNNIIFSYYRDNPETGIWDPDCATYVQQHQLLDYSKLLPLTVYNQSYYSIVAETTYSNLYNQYTEKVAKPIVAKRPFVVFAGQHYLKNLKMLGFQTFDCIIDESYDNIRDDRSRFAAAWTQVEYLCTLDPVAVYRQLQSMLNHNYQHFIKTYWHSAIAQHLK